MENAFISVIRQMFLLENNVLTVMIKDVIENVINAIAKIKANAPNVEGSII